MVESEPSGEGEAGRLLPSSNPVSRVFLDACQGRPTPYTPIWLMRQAGRYMAEYRAVREKFAFLELCHHPEAAAEVTITAVEKLGVDAAIIFADILLVVEPLDVGLEFRAGDGPRLTRPIRGADDVGRFGDYDPAERLAFVYEAVRRAKSGLRVPLIGFSGAPFTLASYVIEGGGSRDYVRTKRMMYEQPEAWDRLLSRLARLIRGYLEGQIEAGADAVQLFDSWVGALSPGDYERFALPYSRAALDGLAERVPVIHFGTGTAGLLGLMRQAGGTVLGIDWRVDLAEAREKLGATVPVQGNLDPVVLLAPSDEIRRQTRLVLDQVRGQAGHVFNLGHGILPQTPVDHARLLVDVVHEESAARRQGAA